MKSRNRDINIFSMSALDLFASAMGAFMLLALVYLVFFTMTSQSASALPEPAVPRPDCPQVPEGPEPQDCPDVPDTQPLEDALAACRQNQAQEGERIASCEAERRALAAEVDKLQFPHIDLVVAIDVTGSMGGPLEGLKIEIDQLVDILNKLAPSFAMGVVAFGDRRWQTPVFHRDLIEVKRSPANRQVLKRVIANLQLNMGLGYGSNPDDPEAVLAGLNAATASTWRPESDRQIVVIVTDNPAYHEERPLALDATRRFVSGNPNRAVSTVFVNTGNRRFVANRAPDFLRGIAQAGRGQFVEDGGSMTANLLLALL